MNRIGFLELHRPKTATERLEEAVARREAQAEEIHAVSFPIEVVEECEFELKKQETK